MLGGVIALRLFIVQVVQHGYYEALAVDNHELFEELFPERGSILVHDRYSQTGNVPIATNKVLYEVHAEPIHVTDAAVTAADLSPLLSIDKADIEAKLTKPNDPDEILKRRVPEEVMTAIKEKNLPGITFREEQWRYYSEGPALAHVTGYFGYSDVDRVGQYGLEGYFNKELAGQAGYVSGEKDALGRFLTIGNNLIQRAVDGDDIVLTIDKNIQYSACDKLGKAVERLEAKKGTLIIMQPSTGAIIAMCNYPTYDPNNYNEVESVDVFSNAAISDEYEPGSAFKTFTMAAGLDTGKVTPTTTYNDTSEVKVAGMPIKNSDGAAHGVQTMTAVLEKSYNLGTIFVTQQIGNAALNDYVKAFGFGDKTGITLANERSGDISSLETLKDVYAYTGSFGHGIMVTPLQLVAGYGAVANHGMLMKPYIVENRILASGAEIPTTPTEVRQVISADAARTLTAMLVSVIDSGTAKPAAVPGYYLAGKTGTALIVSNGVYSTYKHNDTMIGFGPMSDPQFVMLIEMNEPKSQYAEGSVVPVWGEIAKDVLNYMQIPPDRN
ncbi:MAG: penicillin-binding protein 2 [Patescibacteria group bacterium]